MGFDILDYWDKLIDRWETKKGLLMSFILVIVIYFFCLKYFELQTSTVLRFIVIPAIILLLVFTIWITTTNRFFLRLLFSKKIYVGVIVILDEEKDRLVVNKIVRKVIAKINKSNEFNKNIKLKLLPSNFSSHDEEIRKYHENFYFMYDLMIRVFVESGNYESIEKIIIEQFSVTFKRNSPTWKKRIFYDTIDLTRDMGLLIQSKDWNYVISNSGSDKKKYLNNIHNIILYYTTFYAIYSNQHEVALDILNILYDESKTVVKFKKKEGDKITFKLAPFQLAEARLATILIDLYFDSAIKSYHKKDIEKAIERLKQLEKLALAPNKKFDLCINLARWNYEIDNIDSAIDYTNQAKLINSNAIQIHLNLSFFAILKDDVDSFCTNFKGLHKLRNNPTINWVDVLDFQLKQQNKLPSREDYFRFSIAFIEYIFVDEENKKRFEEVVNQYESNIKFNCVFKFGQYVLSQPYAKEETLVPRKQRRKGKGGRRKRRY